MFGGYLDNVRAAEPLVHCITNYVTASDVANALLACGGSPIMADDPDEAQEITAICAALDINLGTLNPRKSQAMYLAGRRAHELGHPVLLDPVGAGAGKLRRETALGLMRDVKLSAIRGNMSEIRALTNGSAGSRGVDACADDAITAGNLDAGVEFARRAAVTLKTVVAITGATDIVSDGTTTYTIRNGRPEMSKVSGTGCQLSAVMSAFLAANPGDDVHACAAAICMMGLAGEIAFTHLAPHEGNATYRSRIIDAIYYMTGDELEKGARYEIR